MQRLATLFIRIATDNHPLSRLKKSASKGAFLKSGSHAVAMSQNESPLDRVDTALCPISQFAFCWLYYFQLLFGFLGFLIHSFGRYGLSAG